VFQKGKSAGLRRGGTRGEGVHGNYFSAPNRDEKKPEIRTCFLFLRRRGEDPPPAV